MQVSDFLSSCTFFCYFQTILFPFFELIFNLCQVEKQRILQVSTGRSMRSTVGFNNENQDILGIESSRLQSAKADRVGACSVNVGNFEKSYGWQPNPNSGSTKTTIAKAKVNTPGCMRSHNGSSSFFDR